MSIETQKLRVVFMGMDGVFSAIPMQYLLAHGVQVCAVVTPGPRRRNPRCCSRSTHTRHPSLRRRPRPGCR
ncbi:MAG: hypothetical protein IPO15_04270 [Anaerolineae bacterium]|uniref:hypothetical protein n=1 Tax=Candidatus Amarolinea dominans TaxID=3140696 RepID=UPI003135AFEF|nr:hypothetical protein [Anaerolineae bacterium]